MPLPAVGAAVFLLAVLDPDLVQLEDLHIGGRSRQDVVLLDVRVIHEEEEPVAEQVVQIVDAGDVVAVEKVEVLEESAVLCDLHAGDILPALVAVVSFDLSVFKHLVDLHKAVTVMEIVVQVDQHLAARDLRPVLQLDGDEYGADQSRGQREDPHRRLLSRPERVHNQQAQQHQQNRRQYDKKRNACLVLYGSHDL